MKSFVTGGAGFVGSNLVELLIAEGHQVVVYDNLRTGNPDNLLKVKDSERYRFVMGDILDPVRLREYMAGADIVFHVAANADIRHGLERPRFDLEQNIIGIHNVLEAMRGVGCKRIAFTSTGSVYGDTRVHPTPEDAPFPIQTSFYSASKVAGEALIQAYCEGFDFQGYIFRHVGMLGEHYVYGHVADWFAYIQKHGSLKIIGDGTLKKSYLYVGDAVRGILTGVEKAKDDVNIFNLGSDEVWSVRQSAETVCEYLGVDKLETGEGLRGWKGDNPYIYLDCKRIRLLGWRPTLTIKESLIRTLNWLKENSTVKTS
jgi:UDP-glucose 4-epimerase